MAQTKTASREVEIDEEIARYAAMPAKEVDKLLSDAGIDPKPTIEAVNRLIQEKLAGK